MTASVTGAVPMATNTANKNRKRRRGRRKRNFILDCTFVMVETLILQTWSKSGQFSFAEYPADTREPIPLLLKHQQLPPFDTAPNLPGQTPWPQVFQNSMLPYRADPSRAFRHIFPLQIVPTKIGGYIQLLIFHLRQTCRRNGSRRSLRGLDVLR